MGNTHIRKYTHARARTHTARQLGIHTHTQPDNSVGEGGDGGEEGETTTLPPYHATPRTRCTHSDGQVSRCSRQTQRPLGPLTTCGEEVIRTQGPAVPPRHINPGHRWTAEGSSLAKGQALAKGSSPRQGQNRGKTKKGGQMARGGCAIEDAVPLSATGSQKV